MNTASYMLLFRKVFLTLVLVVLAGLVSGCGALIGAVVGGGVAIKDAVLPSPVVEVGEVKTGSSVNTVTLKTAKVSSVVFTKDMVTPNTSPGQIDSKVNTAVTDEIKRSLGTHGNATSPSTVRLKTYFGEINQWGWSSFYYRNITERNTLTHPQRVAVKKLVNTHVVLEQGDSTLLEVHGLWVGDDNADEIAGARQLAREMANAVLKKLSAPASRSGSVAEAKKD